MAQETREQKIHRITEKLYRDRGLVNKALGFGVQLDPDFFEIYSQGSWGFFNPDKPRHLPHTMREIIAAVLCAFRGIREGAYNHCKRALQQGATMEEILEAFEVASVPGGSPTLFLGLAVLKRIDEEQGQSGSGGKE
ncbi:carboxymuconolactone decarboxylase family protein [Nitrospinota bacterium]